MYHCNNSISLKDTYRILISFQTSWTFDFMCDTDTIHHHKLTRSFQLSHTHTHAPQPHSLSYLHSVSVYCANVPVWNLESIPRNSVHMGHFSCNGIVGLLQAMEAKGLTQHTETAADECLGSAPLWLWDPWMTCVVSRRITDKRWKHSIFAVAYMRPPPLPCLSSELLPVSRACKYTGCFDCSNSESKTEREKCKNKTKKLFFIILLKGKSYFYYCIIIVIVVIIIFSHWLSLWH